MKIKSSDMEGHDYGGGFKPIKDYLQFNNKKILTYENGELKLSAERERERESKIVQNV